MVPKLINCCRPEQMDTKEFGKMVQRVQTLFEERVPAKEAKNWRIDGEKERITRKEYNRLFWKVSGIVAGFVVTVLCLSRRTVLHACHARMLPA